MKRKLAGPILVAACVMVFLPGWWSPLLACAAAIGASATFDRAVVRSALRVGLVLAAVFAAAAAGALVAWSNGSLRGLQVGGGLLARLLVLWLVAGVLSREVNAERVLGWTGKLGLERLGLVFGLALNSLPHLVCAARDVWISHRTRAGSRRMAWLRLPSLGEVLLAHTARIAEDAAGAASLRGHSVLDCRLSGGLACASPVIVITGRAGVGKTTVLQAVVEELVAQGRPVAGLIQPGIFEDGEKVGFCVRDLQSGQEAIFAKRVERVDGEHGTRFHFFDEGGRLAERALAAAPTGGVLIVDELGPVELRGRGHMPALQSALAVCAPEFLIVTVRRHLVPVLLAALSATDAHVVDVEREGDEAIAKVVELVA